MSLLIFFILHFDKYLSVFLAEYGALAYLILFLIIFFETGAVVAPFLPGDSLIFTAGAFAGSGLLNIELLFLFFSAAAILGDTVNYHIGYFFGSKLFKNKESRFLNKNHFDKTNAFYEKYGAKTIVLARFVPIVRTFAPFAAGVGRMNYTRFLSFNVLGGIIWTAFFLFLGYFFGNLRFVRENFSLFIIFIVILSFIPAVLEFARHKQSKSCF